VDGALPRDARAPSTRRISRRGPRGSQGTRRITARCRSARRRVAAVPLVRRDASLELFGRKR
jgi:hypothetical protein